MSNMPRPNVASSDPHISTIRCPAPHLTYLQLIYRPRAEISVVIARVGRECREGEGNASGSAPLARHWPAVIRIEDRAV